MQQKIIKTAKSYNLTPEELAFIDLVYVGWEPIDAYELTIRKGFQTWSKIALQKEIGRILQSDGAKARNKDKEDSIAKKFTQTIKENIINDSRALLNKATNKEAMLIDLQATLETTTPGSKEWLDIKKMIIDVSRMKQDEVQTEDTTIHYFLPVEYPTSCEICLIFLNKKNKKE